MRTRCRKLIARGENVNEALHYAIGRGRLEVVNLMLASGADLYTEVKPGDYWVPPPRPPTPPVCSAIIFLYYAAHVCVLSQPTKKEKKKKEKK